jgi:hypothetical protein
VSSVFYFIELLYGCKVDLLPSLIDDEYLIPPWSIGGLLKASICFALTKELDDNFAEGRSFGIEI